MKFGQGAIWSYHIICMVDWVYSEEKSLFLSIELA